MNKKKKRVKNGCFLKNAWGVLKKGKIVLLDYKLVTTVQTPQITAYVENEIAFFCAKWQPFLEQPYLNFRRQTAPRRFYRLQ